jgi:type II secretory pathway component PulM
MNALLQWWRQRPAREQALLAVGAAALLVTGAYLAVEPVFREAARKRAEIPELRRDLRWMQRQVPEIRELRRQQGPSASGKGSGPVLPRIEQTARAQGIRDSVEELQGQGEAGARVQLSNVAFPALLDWLATLRERGGIRAVEADIHRPEEGSPGRVDAELVLRRAGEGGS